MSNSVEDQVRIFVDALSKEQLQRICVFIFQLLWKMANDYLNDTEG